jgi:hypothetical protein
MSGISPMAGATRPEGYRGLEADANIRILIFYRE